jgi:hypothetical protein
MNLQLSRASAPLAAITVLILVTACAGSAPGAATTPTPLSSPSPTCVNAKAAHRAYVVVQHLDARVVQACVGFEGADLNGDELMRQSGIPIKTQTFSFGMAYCQLDGEPAQYDQCFNPAQGAPNWSLFVARAGGSFKLADAGAGGLKLADKDALGWRYQAGTAGLPPPPKI